MQYPALYRNPRCEVEIFKDSLLGSGGEQAGRENKMGTEEKCLQEYNLTLTFEETMGRWVPFTCASTTSYSHLKWNINIDYVDILCLFCQNGNVRQRGGGVGLLSSEARHGCP